MLRKKRKAWKYCAHRKKQGLGRDLSTEGPFSLFTHCLRRVGLRAEDGLLVSGLRVEDRMKPWESHAALASLSSFHLQEQPQPVLSVEHPSFSWRGRRTRVPCPAYAKEAQRTGLPTARERPLLKALNMVFKQKNLGRSCASKRSQGQPCFFTEKPVLPGRGKQPTAPCPEPLSLQNV